MLATNGTDGGTNPINAVFSYLQEYGEVKEVVMAVDDSTIQRTKTTQVSLSKKLSDGSFADLDIANTSVMFFSNNPDIATADENGVVTGKKVGSTEINGAVLIGSTIYLTNSVEITVEELEMDDIQGFEIESDPSIVEIGEEVVVTIAAKEAADLAGFDVVLTYDSELLELSDVEFNEEFGYVDYVVNDGTIALIGTLTGQDTGRTGDIELARLIFTAKDEDALASVTLLQGSQISDIIGGLYTSDADISQDIPVANSDITGGGTAINDLVLVAKAFGAALGEEGYDPALDMNKDGIIDIIDIAYVAARILNK